ncbi:MAG: DUF2191 domain-containing protein [Betaproteobacteria bacterium]|nr:DUF2191 domain-containing protein [Betaproteobacteria bacterium]
MRTTVTLDEDVAAKLRLEARRSGRPFKQTLNDALRRGLLESRRGSARRAFRVKARDLGRIRPGISLDDIGGLLDRVEGERRR